VAIVVRGKLEPLCERCGCNERKYDKHRRGTLESDYDLAPVDEYRRDNLAGQLAEYLDSVSVRRD